MPKTQKQEIGAWGEKFAEEFLLSHGYRILTKNYRTNVGEIDIIASFEERRFGTTLSFIEVKTRTEKRIAGSAERAVGKEKRKHFLQTARWYCTAHHININSTPMQFEQISVYREGGGRIACRKYVLPIL